MLYNNICRSPPITERPATASLIPYEAAAPLLLVDEGDDVPEEVVDPPRVVASAVVLQINVP